VLAWSRPDPQRLLRCTAELVLAGHDVVFEYAPARGDDADAELSDLVARADAAGLAGACELTVPVGRLGAAAAGRIAEAAGDVGMAVAFSGPAAQADALADAQPGAGVVVHAGAPGAAVRCGRIDAPRIRLTEGRGPSAALSYVRCLNAVMVRRVQLGIAATDPRLIAIAGERAVWHGRTPESWEYVLPFGVRVEEQQRLMAAGHRVRVALSTRGGSTVRRVLAGRS
jgi:proline dehydrogenase